MSVIPDSRYVKRYERVYRIYPRQLKTEKKMMTSKQKASELYNKFYHLYPHPCSVKVRHEMTKEAALITCSEMTKYLEVRGEFYYFWCEVTEEIQKL